MGGSYDSEFSGGSACGAEVFGDESGSSRSMAAWTIPAGAVLVDEGSLAAPAFAVLRIAAEATPLSFLPFLH